MELYPNSSNDLKRRNKELETERTLLLDKVLQLETANNCQAERIELLEKEIKTLKELCTCPKVKIFLPFFTNLSFIATISSINAHMALRIRILLNE